MEFTDQATVEHGSTTHQPAAPSRDHQPHENTLDTQGTVVVSYSHAEWETLNAGRWPSSTPKRGRPSR